MTDLPFLEIDGSLGEGGGAILRLAAGFSLLYKRPIRVSNIRANRPKPGLRLQHLLGLKMLSELTGSTLSKCDVGSTQISLIPRNKIKHQFHIDIGTAANIGLLLQPIQIACLGFEDIEKIELNLDGGGTFGKWAPSLNYLKEVTYQIFNRSGFKIDIKIQRHGFYPKGGAKINSILYPPKTELKPIILTELGELNKIEGEIIITTQLKSPKSKIDERIKKTIHDIIRKQLQIQTDIKVSWVNSLSPGVGVSLWAHSDTGAILSTGTLLGEKRISSEKLGATAANELLKYIRNNIPVDNYLSDQLLPLMAYINAPSKITVLEITNHAKTNLELIKWFTNREYRIIKEKNGYSIEYF
ncbi:MAG: RNA 3'-phosphate cyclase [Promethearchaeota archaeon]|nr:MAG: RNA 3'-phosphate cyclase [Candidatus Lokiarchaeota archaeon]